MFVLRHLGPDEMKEQRDTFKISAVKGAVRRFTPTLASIFEENYQRSVDFGGHPNPHASFSAAVLNESDGEKSMTVLAISYDPQTINFVLTSTAEVGLTALCVLQLVFREKFELLGIRQEIDALKASGLL